MLFRASNNVVGPSSGVGELQTPHRSPQVPHGTSIGDVGGLGSGNPTPGGNVSGFDEGMQAYHPMVGRADKHSSNIVGSGGGFHTGISQLHGSSG